MKKEGSKEIREGNPKEQPDKGDSEFLGTQFPGKGGSDIHKQDEHPLDFHGIAFGGQKEPTKDTAESLLKEYWVLINTKPVELYKEDHRAWYVKFENYIKQNS